MIIYKLVRLWLCFRAYRAGEITRQEMDSAIDKHFPGFLAAYCDLNLLTIGWIFYTIHYVPFTV